MGGDGGDGGRRGHGRGGAQQRSSCCDFRTCKLRYSEVWSQAGKSEATSCVAVQCNAMHQKVWRCCACASHTTANLGDLCKLTAPVGGQWQPAHLVHPALQMEDMLSDSGSSDEGEGRLRGKLCCASHRQLERSQAGGRRSHWVPDAPTAACCCGVTAVVCCLACCSLHSFSTLLRPACATRCIRPQQRDAEGAEGAEARVAAETSGRHMHTDLAAYAIPTV